MANPMLQQLMPSISNNPIARIAEIKQFLSGKDPQALYNDMMQNNPQFAQFVNQNRGKSVDQIAKSYGVDLASLRQLL